MALALAGFAAAEAPVAAAQVAAYAVAALLLAGCAQVETKMAAAVVGMHPARHLRVLRLRPLSARPRHPSQRPAVSMTWMTTSRFEHRCAVPVFEPCFNPWLGPTGF